MSRSRCGHSLRSQTVRSLGLFLAALFALAPDAYSASLQAYGRLPHFENVVLSPDGSRVAFVKTDGESRVIGMMTLASGERLAELHAGTEKLRTVSWADNDHLMITTSAAATLHGFLGPWTEWRQLQVYDVKANRTFMVPDPGRFSDLRTLNVTLGSPVVRRIKDRTVLFVEGMLEPEIEIGHQSLLALFRVDVESHAANLASRAKSGQYESWIIDETGQVVASELYDESNGRWSILTSRGGQMQQALSGTDRIDIPQLLGLGPTADTVLLQRIEDGDAVWRLISLKDGSLGPPMAERQILDRPIEDRLSHRMVGGVRIADTEEYVFFDPALEQRWQAVLRAFQGEHVRFESASTDFHKLIVIVEGERDGFCFELVDLDAHRAEPLGDVYEGIDKPLPVRRITYPAADGLQIPAYLTLPRNRAAKQLPLIVLAHGGPAVRVTAHFDWMSQALASQGYAVLEPNFRGSSLNRDFMSRGFGEWGRKMQTDLSDGVRYLTREGMIDPARVCIVGSSYGGYAALAGVALDPGVYRCAESVSGISDLRRLLGWINSQRLGRVGYAQRYWDRFIGVTGPDDPVAQSISPISHLDAIKVPVLLIHGKDDSVVPFEQSEAMYDALRKQNKEVQLITLKHEDHWLSHSATRLQMLEASVAFLRRQNPPD